MKIPRYYQSLHFSEFDSYISVLHAFFFLRIPQSSGQYTCLIFISYTSTVKYIYPTEYTNYVNTISIIFNRKKYASLNSANSLLL